MEITASEIKRHLLAGGIDLVGIAGARDLILAHPPRPATDLMPTAKSVIVMAAAHGPGAVFSPDVMLWTRKKPFNQKLLNRAIISRTRGDYSARGRCRFIGVPIG